jgi:hypothetical protein
LAIADEQTPPSQLLSDYSRLADFDEDEVRLTDRHPPPLRHECVYERFFSRVQSL